jgi:hypothetical protein
VLHRRGLEHALLDARRVVRTYEDVNGVVRELTARPLTRTQRLVIEFLLDDSMN